ncbi:uncharacterized protein LOC117785503 [Drosophila innubila]|uniref:uncharacterized protein LOC117785503 n=1 Tax=Drosophila innubila TaxID=198719 RepID=UPI00148C8303|nr:uncharacterized protein LOC117785503 [Drosophila innubila]
MSFGHITKLNVNIAKCQTHITYANGAKRLLTNNPSGFAFRSMGSTSCHCAGDSLTQARSFLQRHFGKRGSIESTASLDNFLLALGVQLDMDDEPEEQQEQQQQEEQVQQKVTAEDSQEEIQEAILDDMPEVIQADTLDASQAEALEEAETQLAALELKSEPELHTWHLEQLPKMLPQLASQTEWHMEQLQLSDCAWHLKNCSWRNVLNSEFQLPNCQCHRIKETMGHINMLVNASMPEDEDHDEKEEEKEQRVQKKSTCLVSNVNANIMSLNGLLQQLNQLLEQQNDEQARLSSSI